MRLSSQVILSILSDWSHERAEESHNGTSGTASSQRGLAPLEHLPRWYDLRMEDRLSRRHLAATYFQVPGRCASETRKKSPRLATCCFEKEHVVVRFEMSWRDKGRNKAIGRGPRRTEASFGFWLREMSDLGEGRSKMLGGFASYAFLSLRGL